MKLKPCPFCGGEELEKNFGYDDSTIGCNTCGITVVYTMINLGEAEAQWNERTDKKEMK